jgi:hypothetical protein
MDLTESAGGGTNTITLLADTYYWSSVDGVGSTLTTTLASLCDDQSVTNGNSNGYTFALSAGELGTGKLTVSVDSGTFTLTSIQADLLALMGFTGDMTPTAASFVGTNHVESLWLPDCPVETPYGLASSGLVSSEAMVTLAPDGTYFASHGSKMTTNEYIYQAVSVAKTVAASEGTTGESYETWWLDTVRGEEPWATAGRQVRFYKDTDVDATYLTFNVTGVSRPEISRRESSYDGYWRVRLEVAEN